MSEDLAREIARFLEAIDDRKSRSLTTLSQNLAPSVCSIHGPSTSFSPSALSASAT
jgi:hypothetical protein